MTITHGAVSWTRRAVLMVAAFAVAVTGLVLVKAAPAFAATDLTGCTFTAASSYSSATNKIKRSEVLCRAQYWYQIRNDSSMCYTKQCDGDSNTHADVQGTQYRKDCSGLINMAWHLSGGGNGPNTGGLDDNATTGYPIGTVITTALASWKDLKPGDILNNTVNGHVILFLGWQDSAKTKFNYLTFGSTPVAHRWTTLTGGGSNSAGKIDSHPAGNYRPYRYNNIVDDSYSSTGSTVCVYKTNTATSLKYLPIPSLPVLTTYPVGTTIYAYSDATYTNSGTTYRRTNFGGWLPTNHLTKQGTICAQ